MINSDSYKFKARRERLVQTVRNKGISQPNVLKAIGEVKRHLFVESYLEDAAYQDRALPIAAGQTISQPYTVAFQTELLNIRPGDKVLEVGTGSGYQTAVLLELGAKVFSIERQRELHISTQNFLKKLGYKANFFYGDGYKGLPTYGPFDKILITAGAPYIPDELLQQLTFGGTLVAPVGDTDVQVMTSVQREDEQNFTKKEHGNFVFVPMLKGVAR